jgi:DNA-binding LytR/AlgR family response regulator
VATINPAAQRPPLRIFCIEDNALLVMQLQVLIEGVGHVFAGSAARFDDVKAAFGATEFDLALVDIDLADGRTGGTVAQWLQVRGRPSLFLTGQEQLAADYADAALGTIAKPISRDKLRKALRDLRIR